MRSTDSPRQIREWRDDLTAFRDAYTRYLNETLSSANPPPAPLRHEVVRLAQPAQEALSGIGAAFAWDPPPVTQTPRIYGLVNTMFIHETPFGGVSEGLFGSWPKSYEGILHVVEIAISHLDKLALQVRRKRRNPLYWGDRHFPEYRPG